MFLNSTAVYTLSNIWYTQENTYGYHVLYEPPRSADGTFEADIEYVTCQYTQRSAN